MNKLIIYGLYDPFTGELRYVGQTRQSLAKRLNNHCYDNGKNHKCNWVKSIIKLGSKPIIKIIDDSAKNTEELNNLEILYIDNFRKSGYSLTNNTSGGMGRKHSCVTLETREKLKNSHKKYRVINLSDRKVYTSLMECSRNENISSGALCDHLNRKTWSVGGKFYAYFDERLTTINDVIEWFKLEIFLLESMKKYKNKKLYQYKKIKCLNDNQIFDSIKEACEFYNVRSSRIVEVCKGYKKSYKGLIFKYE